MAKLLLALATLPLLALSSRLPTPAAVSLPPPTGSIIKRAPTTWVHPGVLNSKAQLDLVKSQVAG